VIEKLKAEVEAVRAESWKWITAAPDFPYGHTAGLRRLDGHTVDLTDEENASRDALQAELDRLEQEYADVDDLPDEVDRRLGEIETALAAFEERPVVYDPADITRAGVFVSIERDGELRIERGYVRPEDEPPVEPVTGTDGDTPSANKLGGTIQRAVISLGGSGTPEPETEVEEDDVLKPLSERLVTELTVHRTLALRDALANDPGVAFAAVLRFASAHSTGCRRAPASKSRPRARASAPRRRGSPTAPPPRRSRRAISNGRSNCPSTKTASGRR
jgi:ParB family chromosome partitioning protein